MCDHVSCRNFPEVMMCLLDLLAQADALFEKGANGQEYLVVLLRCFSIYMRGPHVSLAKVNN